MEENMKSIILIGNSAFSFTEDHHKENNEVNCQENKSKYRSESSEKQNYVPFKTITITSVGEQSNCQNSMQQMEPCVFDNNFGQCGFFTQDYANLTVYLNDASLLTNESESKPAAQWNHSFKTGENDPLENYPFFNNENPVDFPFIDVDNATNKIQLNEGLQYVNILNNKIENDVPEYIDINSLVIPSEFQDCFSIDNKKKQLSVPPFLKRNRKSKTKGYCANGPQTDDDDVIFVKEYKNNDGTNGEEVAKKPPVKTYPEPRRNPKRQVQLQKVSYELATKLEMESYFDNNKKYGSKEHYMANTRRSARTTGAVFSPPSRLNTCDYKEWPVEGMHEKPKFNPITKKIEKVSNVAKKHKTSAPRNTHHNRKKAPNSRKKVTKEEEIDTNKEIASITHNTLHHVLSYIEQIKEYNKLVCDNSQIGDTTPDNLKKAKSILRDSCILYSLANDVSDSSLAKYITSIGDKENCMEFLNAIIDDSENTTKDKK